YRQLVKDDFQSVLNKVDVLITPTIPFIAAKIGDNFALVNGKQVDLNDEVIRFTGPGNITGLPALSIPCGLSNEMPVGLQIIGNAFREDKVFQVGRAIEKNVDFEAKLTEMMKNLV